MCAAIVLVIRFISDNGIYSIAATGKSLTEEGAHQCITKELGIKSHLMMAAMRDRESVNDVAKL